MQNKKDNFNRLLQIMDDLREKCPWDKKQTLETLRILTIEETYELVDAIDNKDFNGMKEELGDLMLHLVFYAKIADEKKHFNMEDVLQQICEKLIRRHPHIYENTIVKDDEEVKSNWEKIKMKEGKTSVLQGVPISLPAIVKALRVQEKAKQVGFEWENIIDVENKVKEEWTELKEAIAANEADKIEEEYGDFMFAMINYARYLKVDPEAALEKCNKKFIKRFQYIEKKAIELQKPMSNMNLAEMDKYWDEAKLNS